MIYTGKLLVQNRELKEAAEEFESEREKFKDLGIEMPEEEDESEYLEYEHKKILFNLNDVSDIIENAVKTRMGEKEVVVVQKYNGQQYLIDEDFETLAELKAEAEELSDK